MTLWTTNILRGKKKNLRNQRRRVSEEVIQTSSTVQRIQQDEILKRKIP